MNKIFSNVIFNVKTILKNWRSLLFLVVFFIIGVSVSIIFIPYSVSGGIDFFISVTFPMLIILGAITYNLRNSSLYENSNLSGTNKFTFYVSQFLTLFVVGTSLSLSFNFLMYILGEMGILLNILTVSSKFGSDVRIPAGTNIFKYSSLIILIYLSNLNIVLTFSVYFIIHGLSKNIKNYYSVVVMLLVIGFCFGAFINTYFDDSYRGYSDPGGGIFYEPNIFPNWTFIPSLFYPFFGLNQMFVYGVSMVGINKWHIGEHIGTMGQNFFKINFAISWQWAIVFIQPYIFIIFSTIIGIIISMIQKNKL